VKKIIFSFDAETACIDKNYFTKTADKLISEIKKIKDALAKGYETDFASVNLPSDKKMLDAVQSLITEKKRLNPSILVVVGIGGSNLGTIAVHKALNGTLYNEKNPPIKVYFADTVDSDYLGDIIQIVEGELQKGRNVLINVVTKSGRTTETIANFEVFLDLLMKYKPDNYKDQIVMTTDKGSALWNYGKKYGFSCLGIPKRVGGRYSVFSPVGLFPLGFIDIDLKKLLDGAQNMVVSCTSENISENMAAISASFLYYHYQHAIRMHDTFIFSRALYAIGLWYRQLVSESLGKKFDRQGNIVEAGITPTVSLGTTDLHSVAQLYLGGPKDKFTTFVTARPKRKIILPNFLDFDQFVANIQGKSVSSIMDAVSEGVKRAYKKEERPFVSVEIPQIDEFCIGQFLQWKMLEIIYLGYLLNVNPFDQPQVELYKKETREVLKNE